MEWRVMCWMDRVTQEPHNRYKDYPDCIKDGVTLCKLMNVLDPGCIAICEDGGDSTSAHARVDRFRAAARAYGVPEADVFETEDLLEKHDIPAVTHCLQALASLAQQRGFQGPELDTSLRGQCQAQYHSFMPKIFH